MKTRFRPLALITLLALSGPAIAAAGVLHLPIGDPERRDRQVPLVLDAVTDAATGELLTPAELPARLAGVDLLLIGESHTSVDAHRVQHRIVDELDRAGRRVMIGLEMLPYTHQEPLDRWVAGHYTEEGFLDLVDWYQVWGAHWGYYRELFLLARDRGLEVFAINTPREVVTAVREKGFDNLSEEEAAHLPAEVDTDSEEHLRLFKAYFDDDDPIHGMMSDDAWQSMLAAQCTWDATMGWNAVKAFKGLSGERLAGEGAIMVVLTGNGHVAYGLGIERQAARWFDGEIASVIPVEVVGDDGEPVTSVQASYADFLWGVPEDPGPVYPALGLATRETDDGLKVIHVSEDSSAERAGFQIGDLLLEVDGTALASKGVLARLIAGKQWGDALTARVGRGGEIVELKAVLRRTVDENDDGDGDQDGEGDQGEVSPIPSLPGGEG